MKSHCQPLPFERFLDDMRDYEQRGGSTPIIDGESPDVNNSSSKPRNQLSVKENKHNRMESAELYWVGDNDEMIDAPSMSKSNTRLESALDLEPKASNSSNRSMSTLGPSASVVSREMSHSRTNTDAMDGDGNVWWKTAKPTNAVLSAFRIQFDNNLLLAEVRRLRETVRELQMERDEANAEVERLTQSVTDKTSQAEVLRNRLKLQGEAKSALADKHADVTRRLKAVEAENAKLRAQTRAQSAQPEDAQIHPMLVQRASQSQGRKRKSFVRPHSFALMDAKQVKAEHMRKQRKTLHDPLNAVKHKLSALSKKNSKAQQKRLSNVSISQSITKETPSATPTRRRRADQVHAHPHPHALAHHSEVPVLDLKTRTSSTSDGDSARCSPLADTQEHDEELMRFSQFEDPREPQVQAQLGRMTHMGMQVKGKSVDTSLSPKSASSPKEAKNKKSNKRRSMKIKRKFSSALLRRKLSSVNKSPSSPQLMSPRKAGKNRKFSHLSDRSCEEVAISDLSSASAQQQTQQFAPLRGHSYGHLPPRTNELQYTKSAGNVLLTQSHRDADLKKRQSQSMHLYNARVMDPPPSFLKPRSTSFSATPYRARSTSFGQTGAAGVMALKDRSSKSSATKSMQKRRSVHYVPKGPKAPLRSRFSMKRSRSPGTTPLSSATCPTSLDLDK